MARRQPRQRHRRPIPIVAGKDKLAEAAVEFLRAAKKKGYADFIAEAAEDCTP